MTAADLTRALAPPAPLAAERSALFLDLDGTLAGIQPRPQDVAGDPRLTRLLADLQQALEGRLAIVSGRGLEDLDRILGYVRPVVSAVHGLVVRTPRRQISPSVDPAALDRARQALVAFADRSPGVLVEDKGVSLALHYRLAPEAEPAAVHLVEQLAAQLDWKVQPGKAVAELRPGGPDKGDSVRLLMDEPPFAGATPVFVGDDVTDEDGFAAARDLGGFGVVVGAYRPTLASYRLSGVSAVLDWLEASIR
jgi:trehalose 6-phosphate phosphatase